MLGVAMRKWSSKDRCRPLSSSNRAYGPGRLVKTVGKIGATREDRVFLALDDVSHKIPIIDGGAVGSAGLTYECGLTSGAREASAPFRHGKNAMSLDATLMRQDIVGRSNLDSHPKSLE